MRIVSVMFVTVLQSRIVLPLREMTTTELYVAFSLHSNSKRVSPVV